jgi:hypothetical protein
MSTSFDLNGVTSLRTWIFRDWLVFAILFLFAGLAMYPLLGSFDTSIIGWLADNVQYVYITGRVAEAIRSGQSIFSDPQLNFPDGLLLAATDVPFLSMVAASPWTSLFGSISGYNLIIFLSHVFSGYFAYLWILRLTRSRLAGLIAGLSFLLAPYRIAHSYGHLQLVSTQFLPLFFWSLDNVLQCSVPGKRNLALLALATFAIGFSSQYYLVISLLSGIIYALLTAPRLRYLLFQGWKVGLSAGIGALLSSIPYLHVTISQKIYLPYSLEDIRVGSNSFLDFIMPPRTHAVWGQTMTALYPRDNWIEHSAYLGIVSILLAVVALVIRNHPNRRRAFTWLGVAFFAFILALGTDIWVQNIPLQDDNPIWLPAAYLSRLPGFHLMRVWGRASIIVSLFVSLLAGLGISVLQKRFKWSTITVVIIMGLVIIDLLPGNLQRSSLYPRAIDAWLAKQPGEFAVAYLQAGIENYQTMYGSLFHTKQIPAFNHPTHRPQAYREFREISADFPAKETIHDLREFGFNYLILQHRWLGDRVDGGWAEIEEILVASPDLKIIADVGGFVVVELQAIP